jgi:glycosyltransferase involved in cell wall biosynthesis/spore maturation protein CgeB
MSRQMRFAVVASHPVPYYVPFYRALARHGGLNVRAFFATRFGLEKAFDPGMGIELAWKTDLLSGYDHVILPEADRIKALTFLEADNPSVGAALTEFAPDLVLIHGYTLKTMLRALLWCRRKGVAALMISDSSLHSGTSPSLRVLKRAVLPLIFRQFSAFLSIGDANQTYLETYGARPEQVFRVSNMVDEGFWAYRERRQAERSRVRAELGISDDELMVLYVGKLIERKRPGDLLAALARLDTMPSSPRPVSVLFAGDGAQRGSLERQTAADGLRARYLGFVNIDALPGYYCAADILVHPAEIETFGVIVIEAAILGLPLVLSDRVGAIGPTSIARPGENTLVYPCRDVAALAAALHRLANQPDTLARMAAASLRISQELDGRVAVNGTLAAIDHCLRGRRAVSANLTDASSRCEVLVQATYSFGSGAPSKIRKPAMLTGGRIVMANEVFFGSTGGALAHGLRAKDWHVLEVDPRLFFFEPDSALTKVASRLIRSRNIRAFNAAILKAVDQVEPQVFLTVKGSWLEPGTLRQLSARGILALNYYPDFHFSYQSPDPAMLPLFDLILTTKSFQVDYLQKIMGSGRVAMLHHGYSDLVHFPRSSALEEEDYFADVTYVGNYSPHKEKWLAPIVHRMPDVRVSIVGSRWEHASDDLLKRCALGYVLTGDFYARAVQHSRINIAVHAGPGGPDGWQDLVSTRTFEIPACKGFMLHVDNAEVRGLFEPGREIDLFASEDELISKIEYYLARPALRGEMIERAHRRCVPAYGYRARAEAISDRIVALLQASARASTLDLTTQITGEATNA